MQLTQLVKPWIKQQVVDCVITGIKNDSRQIVPGDLFVAYPGASVDGRLFIDKAVSLGAVAVVYEPTNFPSSYRLPSSVPCIAIPHAAQQLAQMAQQFYDNPSQWLNITGVTGTNGKTTLAYQLAQAHYLLGQQSAYIGTIGQGKVHQLNPLDNTTPDALCLQGLLHQYQQQHIQQVCMEVSSHALSQGRVDEIEFNQAVFTNLTQDHLDYHHTMNAYAAAKALLLATSSLEWAIINQDDAYYQLMSAAVKPHVQKITYGMNQDSDVKALAWSTNINGSSIEVRSPWGTHQLHSQAVGKFNCYNSLALFTSLLIHGYSADKIIEVMAKLKAAPGRMECVTPSPYVVVDYAHTPDALQHVLVTLNQLKKGRLWVIFGCGGDRDKSKRPIMGKVASLYADKLVITSDNPRSEDPKLIIEEIAEGIIANSVDFIKVVNREEAIAHALAKAAKEDIILIAGKGHEAYQQIGRVKYAFSDQEVVKKLI